MAPSPLRTRVRAPSPVMLLAAAAALGVASAASSYPSFAELSGKPYNVTYDERALKIDGEHALFVSGAVHPPRGSPAMWRTWLAEAKANGLNMVQVYIFWNYHEPEEGVMDFGGVQANANLTLFMHEASAAGLFVNLRVGPYVCAEWTYGGIPAWLGQKPGVKFRQTNAVWQPAMKKFFGQIIDLMADGSFFASQGGPIMLVQVENELPKTLTNDMLLQDMTYVAWCGTMAHEALAKANVDVPVTMCNGQTANSTINTCNGNDCTSYLEQHGQNGRILIDQPGLWTENEGGFQNWGDAPPPGKNEDYFWGRTMGDQTISVMKWFARGGSHMNYYMWTGGNNYGRWTGDGITHMYAVDAIVCPDGQRHEPKFSQSTAMHQAIAGAAAEITSQPAQLNKEVKIGGALSGACAYVYGKVAFLEYKNTRPEHPLVFKGHKFAVTCHSAQSHKTGCSALVDLTTGEILFETGALASAAKAAATRTLKPLDTALAWRSWLEPITSAECAQAKTCSATISSKLPIEMTNITKALTTFAYYETSIGNTDYSITLPSWESMAFVAFVDGVAVGSDEQHAHGSGKPWTAKIKISPSTAASSGHTLTLLAEELGYANYGFLGELFKGLNPAQPPTLEGPDAEGADALLDWKQRSGTAGEHMRIMDAATSTVVTWAPLAAGSAVRPATWLQTKFSTPAGLVDTPGGGQLLWHAVGLTRGRLWLNGWEVGRYWTLARDDASACPGGAATCPTQQYYHLPLAHLKDDGTENVMTIFESEGAPAGTFKGTGFAVSGMDGAPKPTASLTEVNSCVF